MSTCGNSPVRADVQGKAGRYKGEGRRGSGDVSGWVDAEEWLSVGPCAEALRLASHMHCDTYHVVAVVFFRILDSLRLRKIGVSA